MHVPPEYADSVLHTLPPDWVVESPIDLAALPPEAERASGGIWNLLSDIQHNLEERVDYGKFVRKLATPGGVQEGSRFQVPFSPYLHQLLLHALVLHRNGQPIDLLEAQNVQVLNREGEMEHNMFGGYLTAVLLLNDTRVGDVIEFSYSLKKLDTLVTDRSSDTFILKGGPSTKLARWRILYAPDRPVFAQPFNCNVQPTVVYTDAGLVDCRWEVAELRPCLSEPGAPSWFVPSGLGLVEYGEFASWNEVAHWFSRLFYQPVEMPQEFHQIVQDIAEKGYTAFERLGLALRFVQDDIRYVSVSVGEHSLKPYDVATVLDRRYGDCKDKALLLSSLLRALGIDALPALVHTRRRQQVLQSLPRPSVFNHAIVRVLLDDRVYWYDATIRGQRGPADRIYCPAYGKALVVTPDTQELSEVTTQGGRYNTHKIVENFKIHLVQNLADYSVTHIYEGAHADFMRRHLADASHDQIEREFLGRYNALYQDIRTARPWISRDDESRNRLEVFFEYEVANLWKPVDKRNECVAHFHAIGIHHALQLPPPGTRRTPFAIDFPTHIENDLVVRVTRPLRFTRSSSVIEGRLFRYKAHKSAVSNAVNFNMQFTTHKDHVMPFEMDDYLKDIRKVAGHVRQSIVLAAQPRSVHTHGSVWR